jgi:hypothetical protein
MSAVLNASGPEWIASYDWAPRDSKLQRVKELVATLVRVPHQVSERYTVKFDRHSVWSGIQTCRDGYECSYCKAKEDGEKTSHKSDCRWKLAQELHKLIKEI